MELAEDSSSASAKLLVIKRTRQTSSGVYELTQDNGAAFFLRVTYLCIVKEESFALMQDSPVTFTDEQSLDILNAALIYSAEKAAMAYLARSEQCRTNLYAKLIKKGINKNAINPALDYLESIHYLDDSRFAGAWLRTRAINHTEGRTKLFTELYARGIDKNVAKVALDDFFAEHNEQELCNKAFNKIARTKRDSLKIQTSLLNLGFTLKQIKKSFEEIEIENI